jgi:hypothetical protein
MDSSHPKITIQKVSKEDQSELYQLIDKNRHDLRNYLGWIDLTHKENDLDNWFVKGRELHKKWLCL